ncbi:hypothetical protein GCM10010182_65310 [Actinomadura cremea]|nr:hypothetical protein GCM10010182_65310 [Actinomadura cremea]
MIRRTAGAPPSSARPDASSTAPSTRPGPNAEALLGSSFRVTERRGRLMPLPDLETLGTPAAARGLGDGPADAGLLATIHPSAVLRAEDRDAVYAGLLDDLKIVAAALG